jgi:hypothetical protein
MMQNTKWHPFLIDAGSVYTTCALFSFLFFFMIFGDRSPSEYLYSVVPRNVLFAQRRVARLNLTRHAAATAICSRGSRGGGLFGGGGCGTAAEGRGLGSGSHCELALERGACSGALEVLAERSAQPSLSWRGGYKASEMRVPAFVLLKGAAPA